MIPFRNAAEIAGRLELAEASQMLLVDAPEQLAAIVARAATPAQSIESAESRTIRSAREIYDLILLWQESRVGSREIQAAALKRLSPDGRLWVVTAMRKVQGPRTPAVHRLELEDLKKAFTKDSLVCDREARLSAWHIAYRFVRQPPGR